MTILLTNDDGIEALGLQVLTDTLVASEEIAVVAPRHNNSGVGHAISLHQTVRVERWPDGPAGCSRISVNGTPADCVKYAVQHYLPHPPELVVSGINNGPNLGINVHYSGTVGAALEAVMLGVDALAVSMETMEVKHWESAAPYLMRSVSLLRHLIEARAAGKLPARPFCLNLNIPDKPLEEIRGLRVTLHGISGFREYYHPAPSGEPDEYHIFGEMEIRDPDAEHDTPALYDGYASLTPLTICMCDMDIHSYLTSLDSLEKDVP